MRVHCMLARASRARSSNPSACRWRRFERLRRRALAAHVRSSVVRARTGTGGSLRRERLRQTERGGFERGVSKIAPARESWRTRSLALCCTVLRRESCREWECVGPLPVSAVFSGLTGGAFSVASRDAGPHARNRLRRTGRSRREPSAGLSFRWFSPFRVFACAAYAGRAAYAAYAAVRRSARGKLSASPRRNAARGRRGCIVACAAMPQDIPEERPSLMEGRMPQPYFAVPMMPDAATRRT